MKTIFLNFMAVCAISVVFSACHSGSKENTGSVDSSSKIGSDSTKMGDTTIATLTTDAKNFLVNSHESEKYKIEITQLAAANASNADEKKMAADFVKANATIDGKIVAIASGAKLVLSDSMNTFHQKKLADLKKLKGTDFDLNYINAIVNEYEQSIVDYKSAFDYLKVSKTRSYVKETLPELENSSTVAKKIQTELNK